MSGLNFVYNLVDSMDRCPWGTVAGRSNVHHESPPPAPPAPLYTPEERLRRDQTPWTLVQGILAPIQFVVFLVSLGLVIHYLVTGSGETAATVSIVAKTLILYTIMITGAIWEKVVFGCYLFARPFFWEDVFSFLVLALHTIYLWGLLTGSLSIQQQMYVALAAYATYVVNAGQFLLKLRAARLQAAAEAVGTGGSAQ
ncbi:3-vinyl bacteriochlorophyllide hydratase [Magnetospirillum fulvum]|uniref:3-vinyl bacteriochlorophyllide hydratase n=1 Tax=Magnetospirillum fulvum TaxID=1082 RepID=A0A1H6HJI8_MAGFU|nr:2-vinyl bacteriochlorophyllide hydratase [Magnetospirillum fulvum]SEH34338.1 3-vinyl bacteriochlorophyllide hydratase [Magnetospirillum fulvum]